MYMTPEPTRSHISVTGIFAAYMYLGYHARLSCSWHAFVLFAMAQLWSLACYVLVTAVFLPTG